MNIKEKNMPIKRSFRFGLNAGSAPSGEKWRAIAHKVEDLGYSTLSVSDHLWTGLAPLTSLMAAAEATTKLRVGSTVFGNDFRHPVVLAREAATIDLLSDGRLEFGIGTGWYIGDYESTGIPLDPPGVRVSRFEEAVHVIKALFGNEPVNFTGNHYKITNLNASPKPIQQPHPPMLIGGGSRRMLSIAAREANIVSVNSHSTRDGGLAWSTYAADATLQRVKWVQETAGDRFQELELNLLMMGFMITNKPREFAENRIKEWQIDPSQLSAEMLLESPYFLIGSANEIIEKLQMIRERYGFSYFTIGGEESIDSFAPILARLAGT
jgi:probable F420-dependent oxidoreductase